MGMVEGEVEVNLYNKDDLYQVSCEGVAQRRKALSDGG